MALTALNPKPMLQKLLNNQVIVRLKWGEEEYKGTLVSTDSYMNIQLSNAEEFLEGKSKGTLGDVLIRCNNVLWITAATSSGDAGRNGNGARDVDMDG